MTNNDYFSAVSRLDFFTLELATWLRKELSVKTLAKENVGVLTYDRTYGDIHILVEVLDGVYAVYLKDYNFGHIKPLGKCVYILDDQIHMEDSEAYLYEQIIPDLSHRILSGEINLDKDLYDYYHIPNTFIPFLEENVSDHITVAEAAAILGVSDSRVKKMVEDRVLDGFKRNNRVYLSKADVEQRKAYIEKYGKPTKNSAIKGGMKMAIINEKIVHLEEFAMDMPNKQFAFCCFELLKNAGKLDEQTLRILMDGDECKERFNFVRSAAILKSIPNRCSESELIDQCKDGTNQLRYYKTPININGQKYIITNYWYGPNTRMPDNRTPFLAWVQSKL